MGAAHGHPTPSEDPCTVTPEWALLAPVGGRSSGNAESPPPLPASHHPRWGNGASSPCSPTPSLFSPATAVTAESSPALLGGKFSVRATHPASQRKGAPSWIPEVFRRRRAFFYKVKVARESHGICSCTPKKGIVFEPRPGGPPSEQSVGVAVKGVESAALYVCFWEVTDLLPVSLFSTPAPPPLEEIERQVGRSPQLLTRKVSLSAAPADAAFLRDIPREANPITLTSLATSVAASRQGVMFAAFLALLLIACHTVLTAVPGVPVGGGKPGSSSSSSGGRGGTTPHAPSSGRTRSGGVGHRQGSVGGGSSGARQPPGVAAEEGGLRAAARRVGPADSPQLGGGGGEGAAAADVGAAAVAAAEVAPPRPVAGEGRGSGAAEAKVEAGPGVVRSGSSRPVEAVAAAAPSAGGGFDDDGGIPASDTPLEVLCAGAALLRLLGAEAIQGAASLLQAGMVAHPLPEAAGGGSGTAAPQQEQQRRQQQQQEQQEQQRRQQQEQQRQQQQQQQRRQQHQQEQQRQQQQQEQQRRQQQQQEQQEQQRQQQQQQQQQQQRQQQHQQEQQRRQQQQHQARHDTEESVAPPPPPAAAGLSDTHGTATTTATAPADSGSRMADAAASGGDALHQATEQAPYVGEQAPLSQPQHGGAGPRGAGDSWDGWGAGRAVWGAARLAWSRLLSGIAAAIGAALQAYDTWASGRAHRHPLQIGADTTPRYPPATLMRATAHQYTTWALQERERSRHDAAAAAAAAAPLWTVALRTHTPASAGDPQGWGSEGPGGGFGPSLTAQNFAWLAFEVLLLAVGCGSLALSWGSLAAGSFGGLRPTVAAVSFGAFVLAFPGAPELLFRDIPASLQAWYPEAASAVSSLAMLVGTAVLVTYIGFPFAYYHKSPIRRAKVVLYFINTSLAVTAVALMLAQPSEDEEFE